MKNSDVQRENGSAISVAIKYLPAKQNFVHTGGSINNIYAHQP
jgi:hypothetical protein